MSSTSRSSQDALIERALHHEVFQALPETFDFLAPNDDEAMPFFMLPALGGGSSLRGFTSWRFRDRHSLLLQGEWRVLVNSFFDTALFYDAGKVTADRSDLTLDDLKTDFGIGFRFHGPAATPMRLEFAKGNEGLALVFSAKAAF